MSSLARQVRQAFYGDEVQRIQRRTKLCNVKWKTEEGEETFDKIERMGF